MPHLALRDVMSHEFVGVSESDGLLDAVELMREENTTSAVVLRGNDPVGVVTAEAILDLLLDDRLAETTAADVMEDTPKALPPDAVVADAANAMGRTGDPRVLVTDGDGVRGIVEARDIASTVTAQLPDQPAETVSAGAGEKNGGSEFGDGSAREDFTETQTDYAEQGVCESCGGLTGELVSVNGQLLCIECRSV
jgi:CBS domain-containing protein